MPLSSVPQGVEATATEVYKTPKWPKSAKPVAEIAHELNLSKDRLIALAESGYVPHWRYADGEIYLRASEVKYWYRRNGFTRCDGRPFPTKINCIYQGSVPSNPVPTTLSDVANLRDITEVIHLCPGIYFLCLGDEVVYVGQSVSPANRISGHIDKEFDRVLFLPWPRDDLDRIESAWIDMLKPRLNRSPGAIRSLGPTRDETIQALLQNVSKSFQGT